MTLNGMSCSQACIGHALLVESLGAATVGACLALWRPQLCALKVAHHQDQSRLPRSRLPYIRARGLASPFACPPYIHSNDTKSSPLRAFPLEAAKKSDSPILKWMLIEVWSGVNRPERKRQNSFGGEGS